MSLLQEAYTDCVLVEKIRSPDGAGGFTAAYQDGAAFQAAIVRDTSSLGKIAEKLGVTEQYTVTTKKAVTLWFHDLFRRESDGKIFRVTSDGDEKKTPDSAILNMRQVTAEEWSLET